MKIDRFTLVNNEKVDRAIHGAMSARGRLANGVGEDAPKERILAAYDRLAGLILIGEDKVKTGCFWDFENNKPFEDPKIIFEFRDSNGDLVLVPEGDEKPLSVKAVEIKKTTKKVKKTTTKKE